MFRVDAVLKRERGTRTSIRENFSEFPKCSGKPRKQNATCAGRKLRSGTSKSMQKKDDNLLSEHFGNALLTQSNAANDTFGNEVLFNIRLEFGSEQSVLANLATSQHQDQAISRNDRAAKLNVI